MLGLLLALWIAEGIAVPLRRLAEDAAQLGAGDLEHRSEVRGGGEAGILSGTLNAMAEQLQARARDLLATREQLRQVTDNLPALVSYVDGEERLRFANGSYKTWLGQEPGDVLGKTILEVYGAEVYGELNSHIRQSLTGQRLSCECGLSTLLGPRQVEVTAVPDVDGSGATRGLFVMMIDVTARRSAEAALLQSERRLRMVADNMPALVTYVDAEERYRFVNAFMANVFKVDPQTLIGKTLRQAGGEKLYADIAPHVASALAGEEVVFQGVWTVHGRSYHYQSTYIPDADEQGVVRGYYAMTFDISTLKETQRKLDLLARVDTLTGLPNRRHFEERLREAMGRSGQSETTMALMFLDIDHFKQINDSLGHAVGDLVLKEFGARLLSEMRSTDIVARLAGDEFVVVAEGLRDTQELKLLAGKIVSAVRKALFIDGRTLSITTSAGVATYIGGEQSAAELLAAADRALYAAKRQGRDRFVLAMGGWAGIHDLAAVRDRTWEGKSS